MGFYQKFTFQLQTILADRVKLSREKLSMPFFICSKPEFNGECCRMNFRSGKLSTIILRCGGTMVFGKQFMSRREKPNEQEKDVKVSQPSGCLDSQSVKTGRYCTEEKSYDGGKKVTGRKRHILVDTEGLPIAAVVTGAGASDPEGAKKVLKIKGEAGEKSELVWVDGTYNGEQWQAKIGKEYGIKLEEVKKKEGVKGWQLAARRWVVERTFGWLTGARRLVKDYELKTESSEAVIDIRMISVLLKRIKSIPDFSD